MKKKVTLWIIGITVLLAFFLIPIPQTAYDDGGTREYTALAYKIVDWNRLTEDGVYEQTRLYLLGDRFKSIDELWERETQYVAKRFRATIVAWEEDSVIVEPLVEEGERTNSDRFQFAADDLDEIGAVVGSVVTLTYFGDIGTTYPAMIGVTEWEISKDLRHLTYTEEWLDRDTAKKYSFDVFSDIIITEIYSNCFFARTVIPMPYDIKLNGVLPAEYCVGDQIITTHENVYYDHKNERIEADLLTVAVSDFVSDPLVCYKPVIYLYPEEETEVSVKLTLSGELTCTYPAYQNGWTVTASPDGTLVDERGQSYTYLYWEGEIAAEYDYTKGFCVRGEDTAAFLEEALALLGLTRREANEFIVYWLPLMQENEYNIITFQTEAYTDAAQLEVAPAPDTVIRVFMTWQESGSYVEMEEQALTAPERKGFTVVEWGGTEIK